MSRPWDFRFEWVLSVLQWGAVGLGLFASAVENGPTAATLGAVAVTAAHATWVQATPRDRTRDTTTAEIMALVGVGAGLTAIGLTGGTASPYLLFLAGPVLFGAAFLGTRRGVQVAVVAGSGFFVLIGVLGEDVLSPAALQPAGFYVLIAVAFSQARSLLLETQEQRDALEAASFQIADRLDRLTAANTLLLSLGRLAETSELNPVSVGEAALRDLAMTVTFRSGIVKLESVDGTVVVARRGDAGPEEHSESFPLSVGERSLGMMTLWPDRAASFSEGDRSLIEEALRPVSLAFENIRLLRDIAGRAVREERVRLARELHDEIGPALASLGLSLDLAIQQYEPEPELIRRLDAIRSSITGLVEEIRATVADLREEHPGSLLQHAFGLTAGAGADGPSVEINVMEHRPPRSGIAADLAAIMTEAFRNAVTHSKASQIRIEGEVHHDYGTFAVTDNGTGFDPDLVPRGHFGLIGLHERAAAAGAEVTVASEIGSGTTVRVTW